jgi:hypothetical protein
VLNLPVSEKSVGFNNISFRMYEKYVHRKHVICKLGTKIEGN